MNIQKIDGLPALEQADSYDNIQWKVFQYEPIGRRLAVSVYLRDSSHFAGFLVCRSPAYLRSPISLSSRYFLTGNDIPAEIMATLPRNLTHTANPVVVIGNAAEFCVICESYSFYKVHEAALYNRLSPAERSIERAPYQRFQVNQARFGELVHCGLRSVLDPGIHLNYGLHKRMHALDGCTLEWWGLTDQLNQAIFRATGLPEGFGKLFCNHLQEMNVLTVMHNVRLRAPVDGDNVGWAAKDPQKADYWRNILADRPDAEIGLLFDSDEGAFSLESLWMSVCWTEDPALGSDLDYYGLQNLNSIHDPLWVGGPPLREL